MIESVVGKYARGAWIALVIASASLGCRQVDNGAFCCTSPDTCAQFNVTAPNDCAVGLVCDDAAHKCLAPGVDHCDGPQDCGVFFPFCVNNVCVECDGAMGCSASKPVCAADVCDACTGEPDCAAYADEALGHCALTGDKAGQCVGCRDAADCTTAAAPVCDANACRGCTADSECASEVCDTGTGECVDAATISYVAKDATGLSCTQSAPCGTFALGLAQVMGLRKTMKVAPGSYSEAVAIAGKTVTIIATDADLTRPTAGPVIDVSGEPTSVTLVGIRIHNGLGASNGDAVKCTLTGSSAPSLALRRVMLDTNGSKGVSSTNCNLTVERSTIKRNVGGGIAIAGGTYTIENNFLFQNGTTGSTMGGVLVSQIGTSGTHVFRFNTLSINSAGSGINSGVDCTSIGTPLAFSNSIVTGNPVLGGGKQVGGNNCAWTYSAIGDSVTGTGNITDDPLFVDPGQDDYHLQAASPAKEKADPAATLAVDFDGDPRPQGAIRDIGADEIKP